MKSRLLGAVCLLVSSFPTFGHTVPSQWNSTYGVLAVGGQRTPGEANAVSNDGSVIVGFGKPTVPGGGGSGYEAVRWDATNLPYTVGLGGSKYSSATGVSDDGSVIVGYNQTFSSYSSEAFKWDATNGMVGLGDLPGGTVYSRADGISGDGSVIVGSSVSDIGSEAFKWDAINGMVGLGGNGYANAASYDGSVIVGSTGFLGNFGHAFMWDATNGMVALLGLTDASDVSGDGSIIVGRKNVSGGGSEAVIWDAAHGARSVAQVLEGFGIDTLDWNLESATGISAYGNILVGRGSRSNTPQTSWLVDLRNPELIELGHNYFVANGISADGSTVVGYTPIPPSLYLFGSGLIGLVGVARRKAA